MRFKQDCEPLLGPGRHAMSLSELKRLCVIDFPDSSSRPSLFKKLEKLVSKYECEGIPCDIWIDGSFVSSRKEPNDIDLLVQIDADVAERLTPSQMVLVDDTDLGSYDGLDSYVDTVYPRGHELAEKLEDDDRTWAKLFGVGHDDRLLKGIAILRVLETDVGLRLRR